MDIIVTIINAIRTVKIVGDLVKMLSEKCRPDDPDVTAARAQVSELQQATYQLQMENLSLQGQVSKLELAISEMKLRSTSDEDWKTYLPSVEEVHPPGSVVVTKKQGAAIYYCPTCHGQRLPIPL